MSLKAVNLSKTFRVRGTTTHAVKNVNLSIQKGEILGIVGESGSGKSTLGRLMVGLLDQDEGQITFDLSFKNSRQMIFQDPYGSLNPRMTVAEIIAEAAENRGVWKKEERSFNVHRWLRRVGLLPSYAERYPHEFSGGQRQRIGIARALAMKPQLVVCDEPISALDVSVQAQIIHLLKNLQKEENLTMVFISHDLCSVRLLCDRVVVMKKGEIVEQGDAERLYNAPQHEYTQQLLSASFPPDPVRARAMMGK